MKIPVIKRNKNVKLHDDNNTVWVKGLIPFVCTDRFFSDCEKLDIHEDNLFIQIAGKAERKRNNVYLIRKYKDYYYILLQEAIMVCRLSEEGYILIVALKEKTVRDQNNFIKSSIRLQTQKGGLVVYGKNIKGAPYYVEDVKKVYNKFKKSVKTIEKKLIELEREEDRKQAVGKDKKAFHKLLSTIEDYSLVENKKDKIESAQATRINYSHFESTERLWKMTYKFFVNGIIDQTVYGVGTRVEVITNECDVAGYAGTIHEIDLNTTPQSVTIIFDDIFNTRELFESGSIKKKHNPVQYNVRKAVLDSIKEDPEYGDHIDNIFCKHNYKGFQAINTKKIINRLLSSSLPPNNSQIDAIKRGIKVEDMLLVLGPPGTGKTTVILEWVKYFVENNKRVLVASQNNKAVDNVLERLAEEDIDTIRVGSEDKVQSNLHHLLYDAKAHDLQNKIFNANAFYGNKIELLQRELHVFKDKMDELTSIHSKSQHYYQVLEELYKVLYENYLARLNKLFELDQKQKSKLQRMEEAYLTTQESEKSNLFTQRFDNFKASWLTSRITNLHNANEEVVREYNGLVEEMRRYYESEITSPKKHLLALFQEWDDICSTLNDIEVDIFDDAITISVDNVAEADIKAIDTKKHIQELIEECDRYITRLSGIGTSLQKWKAYLDEKKNLVLSKIILESVDLVGATCIGINSQRHFKDLDFDVTIIDEAGQIQVHNAIVPISRSRKLIMLGDHKQIPPIVDPDIELQCKDAGIKTELLEKSFFEYLYPLCNDNNKVFLDTQYRMPSQIASLLAECFYADVGEYKSFTNKQGCQTIFPELFNSPFVLIDTTKHAERQEKRSDEGGYYNEYEALIVNKLIEKIVSELNPEQDNCISMKDIGIISPYKQHVLYMQEKILSQFPSMNKDDVKSMVATLDSFQGQECKLIIYSCTRSNNISAEKKRIGFLKELRRLNVALSRCKQQLIFIGDLEFLSSCNYEEYDDNGNIESEKEFGNFIKRMMDYAHDGYAEIVDSNSIQ